MVDENFEYPAKAMILAAGKGTRLRPLTDSVPKCMVRIQGKPILEQNISWLRRFGVKDLLINLHYKPDAVRDYFGDGSNWDMNITYSYEENLLGTAGAVKNVEWFFDRPFYLWYGDNLSTCNLHQLYTFHHRCNSLATISLFHRDDPTASGIIGLDAAARITRFLEKPRPDQIFSHWVNAGIYLLEPQVLAYIPPGIESDFGKNIFPTMLEAGEPLYGYMLSPDERLWWIDTTEDLEKVQKELARRND